MEELLKHGYSKRSTGTELVFKIIDDLRRAFEQGGSNLFFRKYKECIEYLRVNRPASVGSWNILRFIGKHIMDKGFDDLLEYLDNLKKDVDNACWEASRVASNRVVDGDVIMTISNSLCVRRMFKILVDWGINFKVFVLESRPGMEGLELASYLNDLGVETYLIVDSAGRFFMKDVNKVFVGAEAIAVNGAVVGKVGTSLLSLVANEARVRVFVIAPLYKFSFETIHGELVRLPEGDWRLLMSEDIKRQLPENYIARAPLYDVTPPHLIDGIATEYGLFAPQAVPVILRQVYNSFPPNVPSIDEIIRSLEGIVKR